ncbi:HBR439Cp [Eremothecium sinecaudum]|uniref:DNA 3'-5' helicase n=1 Tax=Eremothecium sinecaudum TaxID=45286 RepID=A0A109UXK3_9SACH|nr:HBR439Cp [Eremothecium sinecaudum]AMD19340.1 HBR439Cp [Eremothecium sinecaudum]
MESEILNGLNKRQYEAVTFDPTKALQIVAGPGTGKTKVLTTRYAYLVTVKKINPLSIVMTTFTRKAADEIKERVEPILRKVGYDTKKLLIGTFHSICTNLLHQYGHLIGLPNNWRIFSTSETDPIIKKLVIDCPDQIRSYALSYRPNKVSLCLPNRKGDWVLSEKQISKNISRLKAEALSPEAYKELDSHDEALYHFYSSYQAEMLKQAGLDYDDLLFYAFKLLSKKRCWDHIKHVLVDEFQDTNNIQLELMYLLSRGKHQSCEGVTAVGDPDQSIYAFRSALARNFDEMIQKCPIEYGQVVLEDNYRSTQNILDTSEHVIKQQGDGRSKRLPLRAQFTSNVKPVYMKFPDKFLEGPTICKEILYLKAIPELFSYSDIAILIRQRRQIEPLERALISHRIPYKIIKSMSFWERKETKAILDLIKVVCSDLDRYALLRSLKVTRAGFGDVTIARIESAFDENQDKRPLQVLEDLGNGIGGKKLPAKIRTEIMKYISIIEDARSLCNEDARMSTREQLFDQLYNDSGLKTEFLFHDDKSDRTTKGLEDNEPNKENKRHKNVLIVKSHFLEFAPDEVDPKYKIEVDSKTNKLLVVDDPVLKTEDSDNKTSVRTRRAKAPIPVRCSEKCHDDPKVDLMRLLREFVNFINLYTTTESFSSVKLSGDQKNSNATKDTNGAVTITTIHGSKGLEWPIVFVPGCVEGIIPCVYANSKDDDSDEDNTDTGEELDEQNSDSPKKNKNSRASESIDEERRMFFVALTRAKYLLYITATENNERFPVVPSQFLTQEVIKTLSDSQQLFDSVDALDSLYKILRKKRPESSRFSIDKLLEDYRSFVRGNREFIIWKNEKVLHATAVDFTENSSSFIPGGIVTASAQLNLEANRTQETRILRRRLVTSSAPLNNKTTTLNPIKRQFAPPIGASQKQPRGPTRQYAPTPNNKKTNEAPKIKAELSQKPTQLLTVNSTVENSCDFPDSEILRTRSRIKATKLSPSKNYQKIVTDEIKLEDISDTEDEIEVIKNENEITAGELLHNPDELEVDNRPILTSAKVLADATINEVNRKVKSGGKKARRKVKTEVPDGSDILSRLKKARKASPTINDEVIVLD